MGGAGAKDRRRLQRQPNASGAPSCAPITIRRDFRSTEAAVTDPTRTSGNNNVTKKFPGGVKKPKHLKRKLEAATRTDPSDESRNELLQELDQWQNDKASYLETRKGSKRESRRRPNKAAAKANTNEGDGLNVVKTEEASFVRALRGPKASTTSAREGVAPRVGTVLGGSRRPNKDSSENCHDHEGAGPHGVTSAKLRRASTKELVAGDEVLGRQSVVVEALVVASDGDSVASGDDDVEDEPKRTRGQRRRRGRTKVDVSSSHEGEAVADKVARFDGSGETRPDTELLSGQVAAVESPSTRGADVGKDNPTSTHNNKKRKKKSDTDRDRYCVGRKPVTDFVVGQSYPGKVVYVKPFGVFVDIGCHSDAFCHVSRLSDDYVDDPAAFIRVGDAVELARVVEIDRNRKRITVSFQFDAKRVDEQHSIDARQERLQKRPRKESVGPSSSRRTKRNESAVARKDRPPAFEPAKDKSPERKAPTTPSSHPTIKSQPPSDPTLTPQQQLKRARKLERRAARREAAETS